MGHSGDQPHWLWPAAALEATELCWADRRAGDTVVPCKRAVTDAALGLCALHSAWLRGPGADFAPPQGR